MSQSKRLKEPWYVYADKLRKEYSAMIVEIVDANGSTVIPWTGFDATGLPHKAQIKLAQKIVDAVNREPQQQDKGNHERAR